MFLEWPNKIYDRKHFNRIFLVTFFLLKILQVVKYLDLQRIKIKILKIYLVNVLFYAENQKSTYL